MKRFGGTKSGKKGRKEETQKGGTWRGRNVWAGQNLEVSRVVNDVPGARGKKRSKKRGPEIGGFRKRPEDF